LHTFGNILRTPRIRNEVIWVGLGKLVEFFFTALTIKLYTALLGTKAYGEYSLVLSAAMLVGNMSIVPVQQSYLRYYHSVPDASEASRAARTLIRWFMVVTVLILIVGTSASVFVADVLRIGRWSLFAGAVFFMGYRWRIFGVQLLNVQRRRRTTTLQELGFQVSAIVIVVAAMGVFHRSASLALLCNGITASAFGAALALPLVRLSRQGGHDGSKHLGSMILRFGLPLGALTTVQWVQNFSERYIVGIRLDLASVGVYTAAYQVCGIPFMLGSAAIRGWLVPIAYQYGKDDKDPRQIWAATRVLLWGLVAYSVSGMLILPAYWPLGGWVLRALTTGDFVLPAPIIFTLAVARFVQCYGPLLEDFFTVHLKMWNSLTYRVIGGITVVPICWYTISRWGVNGAVWGILTAGLLFLVVLCLAPGGFLLMVLRARRRASSPGTGMK